MSLFWGRFGWYGSGVLCCVVFVEKVSFLVSFVGVFWVEKVYMSFLGGWCPCLVVLVSFWLFW